MLPRIDKILVFNKNAIMPAIVFALAIFGFYLNPQTDESNLLMLHIGFYTLCIGTVFLLFYFNQNKSLFFVLTIFLCYIGINYLKMKFGDEYYKTDMFQSLKILTPLNLIIFYFLPNRTFSDKINLYFLLLIFAEVALIEKLEGLDISLNLQITPNIIITPYLISALLFLIMAIVFLIDSSLDDKILNPALFYSALSVLFGFHYSYSPIALTFFFNAAIAIVLIAIIRAVYYATFRDVLTGLYSRHSFMMHSKHFPLKYSLGIIAIDDYANLKKIFGLSAVNNLTKMIALITLEVEKDTPVYRYNQDEFAVVFKNEDKKFAFKHLEQIRRGVASSEFLLKRNKPIKITVSGSVSEKKRSDANAVEVLSRAKRVLQKTYKFTQNVTTKA